MPEWSEPAARRTLVTVPRIRRSFPSELPSGTASRSTGAAVRVSLAGRGSVLPSVVPATGGLARGSVIGARLACLRRLRPADALLAPSCYVCTAGREAGPSTGGACRPDQCNPRSTDKLHVREAGGK